MQYTVIRDVIEISRWKREYIYKIPEMPELSASTNYYENIRQAIWYAECDNKWRAEQTNTLIKWTNFIPIVNFLVAYVQHRKYNIFCDDIYLGMVDQVREKGKFLKKTRFILHEQEYFVCNGNTNVIRPWKEYEWSIERQDGEVLAIIKKPSSEAVYKLEISGELPIEILVIMIMMCDLNWFGGTEIITSY